jgi:hypothetical protein
MRCLLQSNCSQPDERLGNATDAPEDEVVDPRALTRDFNEKSSEGETRTLNLAVNSRLLCH